MQALCILSLRCSRCSRTSQLLQDTRPNDGDVELWVWSEESVRTRIYSRTSTDHRYWQRARRRAGGRADGRDWVRERPRRAAGVARRRRRRDAASDCRPRRQYMNVDLAISATLSLPWCVTLRSLAPCCLLRAVLIGAFLMQHRWYPLCVFTMLAAALQLKR